MLWKLGCLFALAALAAAEEMPGAPPLLAASPADYAVTPGEVDAFIEQLEATANPALRVDRFAQFTGRTVYALTFTDTDTPLEGKRRIFISRPHAHEPAGVAACTELARMLAGMGSYASRDQAWRGWMLRHFVVTLVPDANPGGSQRAPVKFWDGKTMDNTAFRLWMFGESGDTPGERFPRVDTWDAREVTKPALPGIAYEQIDPNIYVEPNRDQRSTFFRSFFDLDKRYHYGLWLDLHQTEFENSERNGSIHLPPFQSELSDSVQQLNLSVGKAIIARWAKEPGVNPVPEPQAAYSSNSETDRAQRAFLSAVWRPIAERMTHTVAEVQNNNTRTPPALQVRMEYLAVIEAMRWLWNQPMAGQ